MSETKFSNDDRFRWARNLGIAVVSITLGASLAS